MVDERSSLMKVAGKTKEIFGKANYGSTFDRTNNADSTVSTKQKFRKMKFLKKLLGWKSSKKTKEELLEEGPEPKQKSVTVVTYALCFIMMLAGLGVKMD